MQKGVADTITNAYRPMLPASSRGTSARLVVLMSPDKEARGKAIPLSRAGVVLGRHVSERGITIGDQRLSRSHLRVEHDLQSAGWKVVDNGSSNGTFVNGVRVPAANIKAHDVIRAGDTLLLFQEASPKAELDDAIPRMAQCDLTILVHGETGAGKDVLARRLHESSGRPGAFVAVNCAALPKELIEAELFGHSKGAFSGAERARQGLFLAAEGGTLFLDEIGDLPLHLQPALLRVLQARRVRPLGSDREIDVDCRVIAATHRDLEQAVQAREFRADLYARLAQLRLVLPPLRERKDEILPLLRAFVAGRFASPTIETDAAEIILNWNWPYNVRELESLAKTFVALADDGASLDVKFLRAHASALCQGFKRARAEVVAKVEPEINGAALLIDSARLRELLDSEGGNVSAVARIMGKPRTQIYRWMRALGFSAKEFR